MAALPSTDVSLIDDETPSGDIHPDAFKYWIHCNYCFEIFMKRRCKEYFLSCHHILCEKCLEKQRVSNEVPQNERNPTYKCLMCSARVHARQLGNDMPMHLKELFHPTLWLSDLPTARIYKFQNNHRTHLLSAMAPLHKKLITKERLITEAKNLLKSNEDELRKLKHENMKMERRVGPVLTLYKQRKALREQQRHAKQPDVTQRITNAENQCPNKRFSTAFGPTAANSAPDLNRTIRSNGSSVKSFAQNRLVPGVTSFMQSLPNNSFRL